MDEDWETEDWGRSEGAQNDIKEVESQSCVAPVIKEGTKLCDDPKEQQSSPPLAFEFSDDPDIITAYCSGFVSGKNKYSKNAISSILINHKGVIISESSKYLGLNVDKDEFLFKLLTLVLDNSIYNHYKNVLIYTDYTLPNSQDFDKILYSDSNYKCAAKSSVNNIDSYNVINIPRKLNIKTIKLSQDVVENAKAVGKRRAMEERQHKLDILRIRKKL